MGSASGPAPTSRLCQRLAAPVRRAEGWVGRAVRAFADVTGHLGSFAAETDVGQSPGHHLPRGQAESWSRAQGHRGGAAGPGCPGTSLCFVANLLLQEGMQVLDLVTKLWIVGLTVKERFPKEAVSLVTPEKLNRWAGKALH